MIGYSKDCIFKWSIMTILSRSLFVYMFFIYLSLDREMDTKYVCALIRVTVSTFMSNKLFHFIWTMPKV